MLAAFLKKLNLNPKKIIFVDDRHDNALSVSNALDSMGVQNRCYHYTFIEQLPDNFDSALAEVQVRHLMITGRLLSDDEARAQLEAQ